MVSLENSELPIGRLLGRNAHLYLGALNTRLDHLEIERYYAPLIIIEHFYPQTSQQEIADHLGINKAAMVRILNYLTRHGYIKREIDKGDKRRNRIHLTPKAAANMKQIHEAVKELNKACSQNVTYEDWGTFLKVLKKMNENLLQLPGREIVVNIRSRKQEIKSGAKGSPGK
jgi:DNA-binding MarR family transcriptional regulator